MMLQVGDDNCHYYIVLLDGVLESFVVWANSDTGEILQIDREKLKNLKDPLNTEDCYVRRKGKVEIMLKSEYAARLEREVLNVSF